MSTIDDLVIALSTSCPKLTYFMSASLSTCSAENLRRLYELCPHLRKALVYDAIEALSSASIHVKGSNEDWAVCLSLVLRRNQYKTVTLRLIEAYYYPVVNLKSILESYQIKLIASTSEASLISLLHDLPHLSMLELEETINYQYTDATFSAISEHAKSLTELVVNPHEHGRSFSDEQLGGLIKNCQLLNKLYIYYCGLESLLSVSKHLNLTVFALFMTRNVSEEMLDGLLLDEKVKWPSALEEGSVKLYDHRISYKFNKEVRHWTKHGRS
eukprot:scaffold1206_cov184-Ochromonas_danica.AAC.6